MVAMHVKTGRDEDNTGGGRAAAARGHRVWRGRLPSMKARVPV